MLVPLLVIVSCVVAMALRVRSVWDALPVRFASHFGPSGQPNGFSDTHAFFVFYGVISAITVGGLLGSSLLIEALPAELINLPNRDYWLTPERRGLAQRKLTNVSAWFAAWLGLFLSAVLELVLRANLTGAPLDNTLFLTLLGIFMVGMLAGLILLVLAFRVPD